MRTVVAIVLLALASTQVLASKRHGNKWGDRAPAAEVLAFNLACRDDALRLCNPTDEVHALTETVDTPTANDDSDDSDDKRKPHLGLDFATASCLYTNKAAVQPSCAAAMTLRPAFFACASDMSTLCPELSENKKQCFGKTTKKAHECVEHHEAEFSAICSSAIQSEWTVIKAARASFKKGADSSSVDAAEDTLPPTDVVVRMVMPSNTKPFNMHKALLIGAGMGAASAVGLVIFFSFIACCCAKRGRFHCKKGRECQGSAVPSSPRMATMIAMPSEEGSTNIPYAQLPVASTIN